jgi:hypothetical protein
MLIDNGGGTAAAHTAKAKTASANTRSVFAEEAVQLCL